MSKMQTAAERDPRIDKADVVRRIEEVKAAHIAKCNRLRIGADDMSGGFDKACRLITASLGEIAPSIPAGQAVTDAIAMTKEACIEACEQCGRDSIGYGTVDGCIENIRHLKITPGNADGNAGKKTLPFSGLLMRGSEEGGADES